MGHFTTNFATKATQVFLISYGRMLLISKTVSCTDRSMLAPLSTYQEYVLQRHKWYKVHDPSADKNVLLTVTGFNN